MKFAIFILLVCSYIVICVTQTTIKATTRKIAAGNGDPKGRFLSSPVPIKCATRPKKFQLKGHNYFLSTTVPEFKNRTVDWLEARNICREFCMDAVSIETQEENDLIIKFIKANDVDYIWTSGRECDFKGCEDRKDLLPLNVNGWFWSANRKMISATNKIAQDWTYNPWSQTGHKKVPQPDNAEYEVNETSEPCLAILNNIYMDSIKWHDIACYHEKPFVCEDSEELLNYIAATNPKLRL